MAPTLLHLAEQGEYQQPMEAQKPPRQTVLLVLATHGRGGLPRWALGRTAEQVLERAELPLLLVRPPEVRPFPPQHNAHADPPMPKAGAESSSPGASTGDLAETKPAPDTCG